jgi:hypothetical protein
VFSTVSLATTSLGKTKSGCLTLAVAMGFYRGLRLQVEHSRWSEAERQQFGTILRLQQLVAAIGYVGVAVPSFLRQLM